MIVNSFTEHREQMNLASAFLDGSDIYGNNGDSLDNLRTFDAGLVNLSACAACQTNALYSAILKEHNRIAVNLAELNRHWTDDNLFYESRRIVMAEIQHITYHEFLPIVLGEEAVGVSELQLKAHGHFSGYSSSNKAGIFNEVAVAALPALLSTLSSTVVSIIKYAFFMLNRYLCYSTTIMLMVITVLR